MSSRASYYLTSGVCFHFLIMDNQGEFTADKEMIDSLKLDASILTPRQERQAKIVVKQVVSEFTSMYGRFIPVETLERVKGIEDRVLITSDDVFEIMYTDWSAPAAPDEEIKGIYFTEGRVMAFGDPKNYWSKLPKEVQEGLIQKYGSEGKAKLRVVSGCLVNCIVHEVIHQFQSPNIPNYFFECAVRYYQRQVSDRLHSGHPIEDLGEEGIGFYQQMIERFGDDMHRLFFSGNVEPSVKDTILARFNQEKEKLFPQGRGL